ncbi:MAG: YfiR/HmsC family protein [bacterium]
MNRIILYILIILFSAQLYSQEVEVPIDLQLSIFVKIMPLEKKLSQKISEKKNINILIVYQNKYRPSLNERNNIIAFFRNNENKMYSVSDMIFYEENTVKNYILGNKIDVVLITSLRAVDISQLSEISKLTQVLTLTTLASQVEKGLSVGIEKHKEKPQILINLEQLKREGAVFSSHLLKIARVIE